MRLRRNLEGTKKLIGVWLGVEQCVLMSNPSMMYFSMAATKGSVSVTGDTMRTGLSEEEIRRIIAASVVEEIREAIP